MGVVNHGTEGFWTWPTAILLVRSRKFLYRDELAKGAHLADLGIWKNLFDRSVADDIGRLVSQGYLSIRGDGEP